MHPLASSWLHYRIEETLGWHLTHQRLNDMMLEVKSISPEEWKENRLRNEKSYEETTEKIFEEYHKANKEYRDGLI